MAVNVKRKRSAAQAAADNAVRVRMYDIGFGDCFLLLLPTPEGKKKVLIDCGQIKKHSKSTKEIVERLIKDLAEEDEENKPRVDVVVATHRHADHISGFAQPMWAGVEVGEVWLPWTESDEDTRARELRAGQERLARALTARFQAVPPDDDRYEFLALNALTNEDAVETLKRGFKNRPKRRFLPEGVSSNGIMDCELLPGVTVHVLGPSRDESVISAMDPPANESFFALLGTRAGGAKPGPDDLPRPFSSRHKELWIDPEPLDQDIKKAVRQIGEGLENGLAVALDHAINNTSLMLMFRLGDAALLFPGDSQWGTWKAALADPETHRLLSKTTFYKVGHHGSHNATPKSFVDTHLRGRPSDRLWAMVPVTPHGLWDDIPRKPLMDELAVVTDKKLVRSDDDETENPSFTRKGKWWVEARIPIGQ